MNHAILKAFVTYAAAWAFGNMYLIFSHDFTYQSGTPCSSINGIYSSFHFGSLPFATFPLRTASIILNALSGGNPFCIRYTIISSRQHIASFNVTIPCSINVWAFPNHTSVPCDNPDKRISSSNVVGCVSISIPLANFVPYSGIPNVPTSECICSGVTPRAVVELNIDIVSLSSNGIAVGATPVMSCNIRITVGSSCPSMSNFSKFPSIE